MMGLMPGISYEPDQPSKEQQENRRRLVRCINEEYRAWEDRENLHPSCYRLLVWQDFDPPYCWVWTAHYPEGCVAGEADSRYGATQKAVERGRYGLAPAGALTITNTKGLLTLFDQGEDK